MSTSNSLNLLLIVTSVSLALLTPLTAHAQGQSIVYVDRQSGLANPTGPDPGNSWTNAFKYLQDALAHAGSLAVTNQIQVWVRGSNITPPLGFQYRPDQSAANEAGTNLETSTFNMKSFVRIYGGFAGSEPGTAQGFAQRSPRIYRTTLTGEINNTSTRSDNCYHVVTAKAVLTGPFGSQTWIGVDATAQLDGFYVTAGNADGSGDDSHGGGVFVQAASPTFQNLTIYDNDALEGGGAHAEPPGECGQIFEPAPAPPLAQPQYRSCAFIKNRATSHGAYCNLCDSTTFINCLFNGNTATGDTGAIITGGGGGLTAKTITLINCTLTQNEAGLGAGTGSNGAITNNGTVNLHNSIVWNNTADSSPDLGVGGIYVISHSVVPEFTPPARSGLTALTSACRRCAPRASSSVTESGPRV